MKRSISLALCLAVLALAACGSDDAAKVGTKTYTSTDVPKNVPDNNPTGGSSTISVTDGPTAIAKVTVKIFITHLAIDDMNVDLIAPSGTAIRLSTGIKINFFNNYLGTGFDDAAALPITNTAATVNSGTYRPIQALSSFNGQSSVGTWTLKAIDDVPGGSGSITNWSLTVTD